MCTPLEPKSFASVAATAAPPGVATSVLVTYMFAHEQRRMLERVTINCFIMIWCWVPARFCGQRMDFARLCDATLVPSEGETCSRRTGSFAQLAGCGERPR